jgi:hypothetical protein
LYALKFLKAGKGAEAMDEEAVLQDVAQKWSEPKWEKSLNKEV